MEKSKELHFFFAGNGISCSEEGDKGFTGHISKTRHINITPGKTFTRENLQKIYDMADSGNMIFSNGNTLGYLVLNPIHKPTKEYINNITNEVYQLSVEVIDGKKYVCTRDGQIFSDDPNKYQDIPIVSNPENKKFLLTNYSKEYDGHTLYRIRALKDFAGTGMAVIEVSHRSKEWGEVMDECRSLWKELLNIPDTHEVLFLGGGASLQFLYVAMNFLEKKAAYLETGVWAKKALKEAKGIGDAYALASSADKTYSYIPKGYVIPEDIDYFHITTNNTIYGTEIRYDMDCPVPLIADMSSDIMSRPVDVSKYALIYGGAQKNVGPAGVTFAIVRKDALGKVSRYIPTMLDYRTHVDGASMFNTPPVFSIFVMNETLKWLKGIGGVEAINKINVGKAELLYNEIDRNPLFVGTAAKEDRSIMNVCFVMAPGYEALQDEFMAYAKEHGMVGIKGHRSVGGFRASIYNACPVESVEALVSCMQEFAAKKA